MGALARASVVACLVAAPSSGSGKTVVTTGLIAALSQAGHTIHPAKVGPDYIDPGYLSAAAGRPCVNLDLWAMRPGLFSALTRREGLVVEGVMGLFDGPASGVGSSADVARALGLPVVLVVNAERQSHSVAALAHGFMTFDRSVNVAGVILTRVASARHENILREALKNAGITCLGAIARHEGMHLSSRHLGLTIAQDDARLAETIAGIARVVADGCDLAAIASLAATLPDRPQEHAAPLPPLGSRIACAQDRAFSFTYAHLLEGWHTAGASLHPFSPLAGEAPDPAADAVFLPGGYPELHADALANESAWRDGLWRAAERGAVIYGECGGYMALGETLTDGEGKAHAMAGLLPIHTSFAERKRRLGYRTFAHDGTLFPKHLKGHEFHYATIGQEGPALFHGADSTGTSLGPMGTRLSRVAGSFAHIIDVAPHDM